MLRFWLFVNGIKDNNTHTPSPPAFNRLIDEANRKASDQLGEDYFLRISTEITNMRYLFIGIGIFCVFITIGLGDFSGGTIPSTEWLFIFILDLILVSIGYYLYLVEKNALLIYGPFGFTFVNAFGQKSTYKWDDIKLIRKHGRLKVRLFMHQGGEVIDIDRYYVGLHGFFKFMGKACELDTSILIKK